MISGLHIMYTGYTICSSNRQLATESARLLEIGNSVQTLFRIGKFIVIDQRQLNRLLGTINFRFFLGVSLRKTVFFWTSIRFKYFDEFCILYIVFQ